MAIEDYITDFYDDDPFDGDGGFHPPNCQHCGVLIEWEEVDGKYRLFTPTGKPHRCKAFIEHKQSEAVNLLPDLP